jgi:hypothetical protein
MFWCVLKQHVSAHVGHLKAKINVKHLHAVYIAVCGYCDLSLHIHYIIKLCVNILVKNLVKVSDVLVYTPDVTEFIVYPP